MKHWSGLIYLVVGVVVGLLIATSLAGLAAAGSDENTRPDSSPGRYTLVVRGDDSGYVFDTHTGTLYGFSWFSPGQHYKGLVINPVEGWWKYATIEKPVAPEPADE
jgi:hypothetical protein